MYLVAVRLAAWENPQEPLVTSVVPMCILHDPAIEATNKADDPVVEIDNWFKVSTPYSKDCKTWKNGDEKTQAACNHSKNIHQVAQPSNHISTANVVQL